MITIIFASYNGEATLSQMLDAFCSLKIPQGGWKIIAVDNRSTDRTVEILKDYQQRLPLLLLFQQKPGKNSALNMALTHIEGDLVVFTDDDIIPDPDWLIKLTQAADQRPGYNIFGGAIVPNWPKQPPNWILDYVPLGPAYVVTPPTRQEGPLRPSAIWGPNMMIRSHIFTEGIQFDETIGPGLGPDYPMGSETELTERLVNQGCQCWFVPDAVVAHVIRADQMRFWWVMRRAIRSGKGAVAKQLKIQPYKTEKIIFGAPRWLFRELANNAWAIVRAGALLGSSKSIYPLWNFFYTLGQINHHRCTHRNYHQL